MYMRVVLAACIPDLLITYRSLLTRCQVLRSLLWFGSSSLLPAVVSAPVYLAMHLSTLRALRSNHYIPRGLSLGSDDLA